MILKRMSAIRAYNLSLEGLTFLMVIKVVSTTYDSWWMLIGFYRRGKVPHKSVCRMHAANKAILIYTATQMRPMSLLTH